MVIHLNDYPFKHNYFSIAVDNMVAEKLSDESIPTIIISETYYEYAGTGVKRFYANLQERSLLSLHNYDVLEINENGEAYLAYDTTSADNGFVVTGKCNSNCIMCPTAEIIRQKSQSLTPDSLIEFASHIPQNAVHLTITGGEPFLLGKDLFGFLKYLKNRFANTEFLLLTNGRVFALKDYCFMLKDNLPEKTTIGIPLHGYNQETHDYVTQSNGSFAQTAAGLRNLLKLGMRIELRIVVSKLTAGYISDIAKLIVTDYPEIDSVKIMGLEMLGNANKNKECVWIPYRDAFRVSKNAINMLLLSGIDVSLYNFPLCSVDKEYWNLCAKSISKNKVKFANSCDECSVKDACGGMFSGTFLFAKNDIEPIN